MSLCILFALKFNFMAYAVTEFQVTLYTF